MFWAPLRWARRSYDVWRWDMLGVFKAFRPKIFSAYWDVTPLKVKEDLYYLPSFESHVHCARSCPWEVCAMNLALGPWTVSLTPWFSSIMWWSRKGGPRTDPPITYVSLEKLLPFPVPQFLQLQNGNDMNAHLISVMGIGDTAVKGLRPGPGTQ